MDKVTLPKPPGIGAIWAAALTRPPVPRAPELPDTVHAVRGLRVDSERSTQFNRVVGAQSSNGIHPGMLHVLAFPVALSLMAQPRFPFPLLSLIHISNEVLQHRTVRAGELIDVECRVQNLAPHRHGRTFETVSVISNRGRIIATEVSTYLARGYAEEKHAVRSGRETGHADSASIGEVPRTTEDMRGKEFVPPPPTGRWKLPGNVGRVYAKVSGDANPIHMTALSAKALGFPAVVAHGMYAASRALSESLPDSDFSGPLRWDARFDAPIVVPATVWMNYTAPQPGTTVQYVGYRARRGETTAQKHFSGSVTRL